MGGKFINDLDDGIESTLTKFADDTKVSHGVDTSEGRAILRLDLDKLEEWANKNYMKFNKDKLGAVWLGSSFAEKDLRVLVDNQLNMSVRDWES
ncbi:hypothetical protein QYF61_023908 [Mycteria americana]|uniref:Rna-directed dna polymerase from mobile element jockey-like n=1 Tax=Mycteria americana TaxID=33587 RepID=A0AAN7RR74_MYCAM|nr:hypothetical protein QYF61_023908 [Mycteria americana]